MTEKEMEHTPADPLGPMVHTSIGWLDGSGDYPDIVLSSRARLARNIKDIPFSHQASDEQLRSIHAHTPHARQASPQLKTAVFLRTSEMS